MPDEIVIVDRPLLQRLIAIVSFFHVILFMIREISFPALCCGIAMQFLYIHVVNHFPKFDVMSITGGLLTGQFFLFNSV
jgi:hypothetical protein